LIVLDTHVLVWWVAGADRLSARARRAIAQRLPEGPVVVSTITVLEIATAVRRGRLELGSPLEQWLSDLLVLPEVHFEPVSVEIARVAGSLEDPAPGDPADRLILATAKTLGAKLITADDRLRASPHAAAVW
jgi:PIN domain nuclease of toxin-antitoxin system